MRRIKNSVFWSLSRGERSGKGILRVLLLVLAAAPSFVMPVNLMASGKMPPSAMIASSDAGVKNYRARVMEVLPHSPSAYTQGLFFKDDVLYESCGQYGESSFRKVDLKSGRSLNKTDFDERFFIEGSCVLDGYLYLLTWRENVCFVYDFRSMTKLAELFNPKEGWGLTTDGKDLIMSTGSQYLYFLDPQTFMERRSVRVTMDGKDLYYLNELEYVDGKVWANVYTQDFIVVIDPETGVVEAKIDCSGLLTPKEAASADVFNGIAVNGKGEIFVTGKYWPKMFRITLE